MAKDKSFFRLEQEKKGDEIVKMEVFKSDRDFFKSQHGMFSCARDNLHVLVRNIKNKKKVNSVEEFFRQNKETDKLDK